MAAGSRKAAKTRRKPAALRQFALKKTVAAAALCNELLPVGGDELPVELTGWRDGAGRCRRVRAVYANGWELNFRINAKGDLTSSSARIRLSSTPGEFGGPELSQQEATNA